MRSMYARLKQTVQTPKGVRAVAAMGWMSSLLGVSVTLDYIKSVNAKRAGEFRLNTASAIKVAGESRQVVVYGFAHCQFTKVYYALQKTAANNKDFHINNVGHWAVTTSPKGSFMDRIKGSLDTIPTCKRTLTNIVLENYIRISMRQVPIPIIFCIDIDNNPHPFKVENMLSKDPSLNKIITHKELRRACKLCHDANPEVGQAANKTFKFVKVKQQNGQYSLEELPSPCNSSEYNMFLEKRRALKAQSGTAAQDKSWREQLRAEIATHNKNTAKVNNMMAP